MKKYKKLKMTYWKSYQAKRLLNDRKTKPIVYRLTKYKTAKYASDTEELWKLFFRKTDGYPDLRASVYSFRSDELDIPRIKSEHTAFSRIDPESRGGLEIGMAVTSVHAKYSPDGGCFSYREEHHYELQIENTEELIQICKNIIDMGILTRAQNITEKTVILGHVKKSLSGELGAVQQAQWIRMAEGCDCPNRDSCNLAACSKAGKSLPAQGCDKVKRWVDKLRK
jgi:hypothetical protein